MQEIKYVDDDDGNSSFIIDNGITVDENLLCETISELTVRNKMMIIDSGYSSIIEVAKGVVPVTEKCEELLSCLQSVGIISTIFGTESSDSMPFCRQNRYIEQLGPLSYDGDAVIDMSWPSVGFEIVTKKYVRNFGIYFPDYGIVSSNKVSHVIYGMAEYPDGDEMIVFSIKTKSGVTSFEWGPRGIHVLQNNQFVHSYYIVDRTGIIHHISGYRHKHTVSRPIEWFHNTILHEGKDYIINIDGVNYLLLGTRKMVARSDGTNVYYGKNLGKSDSPIFGSVMYDLDKHMVLYSTKRAVESQTTYDHIMKDSYLVSEFNNFTKVLDRVVPAQRLRLSIKIVPPNSPIVENETKGVALVFDRGHSKSGTSRNARIMERNRLLNELFLDDVSGLEEAYVGNNRFYKRKKTYRFEAGENHPLYKYVGKWVYIRLAKEDDEIESYETQLGFVVALFVALDKSKIGKTGKSNVRLGHLNPEGKTDVDYKVLADIFGVAARVHFSAVRGKLGLVNSVPNIAGTWESSNSIIIPVEGEMKTVPINIEDPLFDIMIKRLQSVMDNMERGIITEKEGSSQLDRIYSGFYASVI